MRRLFPFSLVRVQWVAACCRCFFSHAFLRPQKVVVGLEVGGRFGALAHPRTTLGCRCPRTVEVLRDCCLDLALVWAPGCRFPARLRRLAPRGFLPELQRSWPTPGATSSRLLVIVA